MENQLQLYPLHEAIKKFFAGTGVQERDLQKEVKRGRLILTKIDNRVLVSEDALKEMLKVCQEKNPPPDSTLSKMPDGPPCGSSSTVAARSALDALNQQAGKLRSGSPNTSRRSTKPPANVVRLPR